MGSVALGLQDIITAFEEDDTLAIGQIPDGRTATEAKEMADPVTHMEAGVMGAVHCPLACHKALLKPVETRDQYTQTDSNDKVGTPLGGTPGPFTPTGGQPPQLNWEGFDFPESSSEGSGADRASDVPEEPRGRRRRKKAGGSCSSTEPSVGPASSGSGDEDWFYSDEEWEEEEGQEWV